MPVSVGQILDLEPERLVAGGDALARVDGLPVFVPGAYPGDRIRAEITEAKKGFARARVLEILHEGPERRAEPCPVARECGGCDWTELRLDRQIHWKRTILVEVMRRIGKLDPATIPAPRIHASPLNYRLRSRLQVDTAPPFATGFYAVRSHRVVPLPAECEVVGPKVIAHLDEIRVAASSVRPAAIETLENEREIVVHLHERESGEPPVTTLTIGPYEYRLSAGSFFQVNRHLLSLLQELVMESAAMSEPKRLAWDLYGGVGFFALPLSSIFDRVVTVESSQESHRWAVSNGGPYSNLAPVRSDVTRFLQRSSEIADFILVDPPRAGLDPEVTRLVGESGASRICYLSCDPVTFSRDAARLLRLGWTLASIDLIDLFPNTHHIETLSSFVRER